MTKKKTKTRSLLDLISEFDGIQVFRQFINAQGKVPKACAIGGGMLASGCIDIIRAKGTMYSTKEKAWIPDDKSRMAKRVVFRNPQTGAAEEAPFASEQGTVDHAASEWLGRHWVIEAKPRITGVRELFGEEIAKAMPKTTPRFYDVRFDMDARNAFKDKVAPDSLVSTGDIRRIMETMPDSIRNGQFTQVIYTLNDTMRCTPTQVVSVLEKVFKQITLVPICDAEEGKC